MESWLESETACGNVPDIGTRRSLSGAQALPAGTNAARLRSLQSFCATSKETFVGLKATILGAIAAAVMTSGAYAAPPAMTIPAGVEASHAEQVAARCWRRHGKRVCAYGYRATRQRVYGIPERYRAGSKRWWEEMDRTERGGRR
jgi:hypothetical protein